MPYRDFETLHLAKSIEGVARITLTRAEKHNAMSPVMMAELTQIAAYLRDDNHVRVVVLASEGPSFSAGADLNWMQAQLAASREERKQQARQLAQMLQALDQLPQPLIARVQGRAFGGGLGLISVCDAAIAVDNARFGFTETRLGLIPATIAPYVIARIGAGAIRSVFFSPKLFDAAEALRLKLITQVVSMENLDRAVEAEVTPYLAAAPEAVARAKALLRSVAGRIDQDLIEHTIEALADTWDSQAAAEGVAAFFEKRAPAWHI